MDASDTTHRHRSSPSIDTYVSGIAESTLTFSGLGQFPLPPPSTPNTPTRSEYGRMSPSSFQTGRSGGTIRPLPRAPTRTPAPVSADPRPGPSTHNNRSPYLNSSNKPSQPISSHDWHDGASSIDVDETEDRLLSTSFITSLLQEHKSSRPFDRRTSIQSDALSGVSETTYPPSAILPPSIPNNVRIGHPPPISIPSRHAQPALSHSLPTNTQEASDADTIYSHQDFAPTLIQAARRSNAFEAQGISPIGIAPARLHSVVRKSRDMASLDTSDWQSSTLASGVLSKLSPTKEDQSESIFSSVMPMKGVPLNRNFDPQLRNPNRHNIATGTRQSVHSVKSFVPSLISAISSTTRMISRVKPWKKKPLPPVPLIPDIPIAREIEHRKAEESMPLPELVARAGALNGLLEKGYHPHQSISTYHPNRDLDLNVKQQQPSQYDLSVPPVPYFGGYTAIEPPKIRRSRNPLLPKNKKLGFILAIFIIIALAAIGAGIGVSVTRKNEHVPVCSGNFTGRGCDLDAACVCTSNVSASCDALAQNLVTITTSVNALFNANYTPNSVYNAVLASQTGNSQTDCASQARLVDVAPGLSSALHPNRTLWAQSAILWNLVQSHDLSTTSKMQKFVASAPWSKLDVSDGPVPDASASFTIEGDGYTFDFAAQAVSGKASSFVIDGQPTNEQITRVNDASRKTLDRMYGYATASKAQRQRVLASYWTNVLQLPAQQLPVFMAYFASSPILLPFDATSPSISKLYNGSSSFPPPLGCYPSLGSNNISIVNSVQASVYGITTIVSSSPTFDASCFPDQPVYGVLDILRLRLPFSTSQHGFAQQAAVLTNDVSPRAVIHNGELLSTLPGPLSGPPLSSADMDPRRFGTLNNMDHIVLDFFNSISDTSLVQEVVKFVTSANISPPTPDSILAKSLSSIPVIEVAVFGSVLPSDIQTVVSSYINPAGALFFGSSSGQDMRTHFAGQGRPVLWAEDSLSTLIVHDGSLTDLVFNETWTEVSKAVSNHIPLPVANITSSFSSTGKLTQT